MSSLITPEQAQIVLHSADLLYTQDQINRAIDQLASAITSHLKNTNPLVLMVMNGGFLLGAELLLRLSFPLQVGYLHATRYRGGVQGSIVDWIAPPRPAVKGRTVLVVDDIYDEGNTLKAILDQLRHDGAIAVYSAVLVNKHHERKVPGLTVDFVGLEVPDRYVFGYGMDYQEYWRQLPAVYALRN